jgi:hypothetical protein
VPLYTKSNTFKHETRYSGPSHCCASLQSVLAKITDPSGNPCSVRDSSCARFTSVECIPRASCSLLLGWQYRDKGMLSRECDTRRLTQSQVKHDIKAKLTQSATGASGGEGTRNHVQVIANSGVASVLILLHLWQLKEEGRYVEQDLCWHRGSDALVVGIVA